MQHNMLLNDYLADKFCRTAMQPDRYNNPDANKKCAFPMGTLINQGIQDRCIPSTNDKTVFECPTFGYDKKKHSIKDKSDHKWGICSELCPKDISKTENFYLIVPCSSLMCQEIMNQ